MDYRIYDVICIKVKNQEYVPYVFNNECTKLKNLETNEILEIDKNLYERDSILAFEKLFGNFTALNLFGIYNNTATSGFWEFFNRGLIEKLNESTCSRNYSKYISDKKIKELVKLKNAWDKIVEKQARKKKIKSDEIEQSHEF